MRLQSRYWLGMFSFESLTGTRGSIPNIAHAFGCWQEALVLYPTGLTEGCSSTLVTRQLASPRGSDTEDRAKRNRQCLL